MTTEARGSCPTGSRAILIFSLTTTSGHPLSRPQKSLRRSRRPEIATALALGVEIAALCGKYDDFRFEFHSGRGYLQRFLSTGNCQGERPAPAGSPAAPQPLDRSPRPCVCAMTDIYSQEKRSKVMARVPAVGSKPELSVRQVAHGLGYRFRLHKENLPGRPDLVFPRHRKVIFVHGCFWHGHENCKKSKRPETNRMFWEQKLSRNMERDLQNALALKEDGWLVLVVWECETRNREQLTAKIDCFLGKETRRAEVVKVIA